MESLKIDRANIHDLSNILELYIDAYDGHYPDPTFTDITLLKRAIEKSYIFVGHIDQMAVACVKIDYDDKNLIAKGGAAVVASNYRGHNFTQKLLNFGINYLKENTAGLELTYVITRTRNESAQTLTEKMGFKKLGIFPNVHKTDENETHALAALIDESALKKRYVDFNQHPKIKGLYELVQKELDLPEMECTTDFDKKVYDNPAKELEIIDAPNFVYRRKTILIENNEIDFAFFPFHIPTHLITNDDQTNEIFCYINKIDKYSVITGIKIDREVDLASLLIKASAILRDKGVRYIEILVRANRLNIIEKFLRAKFIPSGYFPAFQLEGDKRYDYVVFSKSFEILDFSNIKPKGLNKLYLKEYTRLWEEIYLNKYEN
tara:strand:+ start:800 stop:1930 length:1131 start_codon:yes stop_codon:yes gene_type:complete